MIQLHQNNHFQILFLLLLPSVISVTLNIDGLRTSTTETPIEDRQKNYVKRDGEYGFSYGVSDQNTGDHKTHWEKRENGVVSGAYSVLDPDGSTRLVQYRADNTGFHPIVQQISPNRNIQSVSALSSTGYYPSTTPLPYQNQNVYYSSPPYYNRDYFYNNNNNNNRPVYPNTGYNYNGRYYFPDRAGNSYNGYDSSYLREPYNLRRNRQRESPVPLLHSTYRGYDNLYH